MNELAQLIRIARQRSLRKAAVAVGVPPSSLTVRSDIAAKGPMFTPPNEITSGEFGDVGNMTRWLEAVPEARRRQSYKRMAGRNSVKRRNP